MNISLSRRGFLVAGAAAATAAHAQYPAAIDTHIHLWDTRRPEGVDYPPRTDSLLYRPVLPAEYTSLVRPLGVAGAIVIEASSRLEDNQWVLDLIKNNPMFVGYVGHLDPGADGFRDQLARFAKNRLFRGIRVGGADLVKGMAQPAFLDGLKRLADADLSLDALGDASMVPPLLTIAEKIPNLRIAIDHMPVEPPGWKPDTMSELAKHPRVYCKVSTVLKRVDGKVSEDPGVYQASLDQMWKMFGPDRVMYGSNWPVSLNLAAYAVVLRVVKQYVMLRGAADTERYFIRNSRYCYKWTAQT